MLTDESKEDFDKDQEKIPVTDRILISRARNFFLACSTVVLLIRKILANITNVQESIWFRMIFRKVSENIHANDVPLFR